jgi:hypothetical protein
VASIPPKRDEPERLKRGKAFHKDIQAEWEREAEGDVRSEQPIAKLSGRRGRIDVHVDDGDVVAVVELKATDWDRMTPQAVRRNVRRQAAQVWQYVESQLTEGKDVCPGVIFPCVPSEPERVRLIEGMFEEEGIQVVWRDETTEECRERHRGEPPK